MLAVTLQDFLHPYVLFVFGLGLITWGVVRSRKRKLARGTPAPPRPVDAPSSTDVRGVVSEVNELMVELHETSRHIAAQIDNRASKLNALLEEADARIARLEALKAELDALRSATAPTPVITTQPPPAATAAPRHEDARHRRIYDLADRGHSPREIAQQLGTQPGEIELILNLRR